MRIGFLFISLFIVIDARTQSMPLLLENSADFFAQKYFTQKSHYFHSSIRPYILADSLMEKNYLESKAVLSKWLPSSMTKSPFKCNFYPLLGVNFESHSSRDTSVLSNSIGFMANVTYKQKLSAFANYAATKGGITPYLIQRVDTLNIVPGFGLRYNASGKGVFYDNLNFGLSWSPNTFFNLQVGKDKHFWGYGYRSLFLSDNATNFPFLKFTTNFWRIKYVSMVAQMKDIRYANGDPTQFVNKYGTFHMLSWNISKSLNLNVFEAVIWQAKDTLQNRQLDIHYLNPVIFYRPVEYGLGSSDNSILGMGLQYKITNGFSLYSQALLDEFVLDQIKADSGWWANKYGLQFGLKWFEPLKIKGLYVQTEYNAVRPFTYSHGSVTQNYAHFYQPLAHPMGANFRDWVTILQFSYKSIVISNKTVMANYGSDTSGLNFGGDLFQSYRDRAQDYHNYIGQGLNNELLYNKTSIELVLAQQNNLRFELGYVWRRLKNEQFTQQTNFVFVAIRTNLYNRYNDF